MFLSPNPDRHAAGARAQKVEQEQEQVFQNLQIEMPPPRRVVSSLPIEREESGEKVRRIVTDAPMKHYTNTWHMGSKQIFPPSRGYRSPPPRLSPTGRLHACAFVHTHTLMHTLAQQPPFPLTGCVCVQTEANGLAHGIGGKTISPIDK